MKALRGILILVAIAIAIACAHAAARAEDGSGAAMPAQQQPPRERAPRKFDTLAHRLLDLEAELEPIPASKYETLDRILADAKKQITVKTDLPDAAAKRAQAVDGLKKIDALLRQSNVIYPPGEWITTMSEALEPVPQNGKTWYRMDCDMQCLTYLSIAQVVGFKLKMVMVPRHNFVRWELGDDGSRVDWETVGAYAIPNAQRRFGISDINVKEKTYLSSMSDEEILGYMHILRGLRCEKAKPPNYKQATADYTRALELYPRSALARNNLAWMYVSVPEIAKSIPTAKRDSLQLALRAVSINPDDHEFLDTLACVYAEMGDFGKAIHFELEAIEKFTTGDPAKTNESAEFQKRLQGFRDEKTLMQMTSEKPAEPVEAP